MPRFKEPEHEPVVYKSIEFLAITNQSLPKHETQNVLFAVFGGGVIKGRHNAENAAKKLWKMLYGNKA